MKALKLLASALFLYSAVAVGDTVNKPDAEHPFLKLGSDEHVTVYIGDYGAMVPMKLPKGDVLISLMIMQNVDEVNHPKGEEVQYVVVANCEKQFVKTVPIWARPKEGAEGVSRFKDVITEIAAEINRTPAQKVIPNTIISVVVEAGCYYVGDSKKLPPAPKIIKKQPDLEI
jgi:hypothetical protein